MIDSFLLRCFSSVIPGSPQDVQDHCETPKGENLFPLSANPSAENLDEQENLVNSDDDDEPTAMPVDEAQAECEFCFFCKNEYFHLSFSLADAQEEKLVIITTEINAKQKCLEMLENARKQTDLIRHRYEERLKSLSERIQHAEEEKQAAVTKLSSLSFFFLVERFFLTFLFFFSKIRVHEINTMSKI